MREREKVWESVRSIPSAGMKLRGPGSSGNAELDILRSQNSVKNSGVAIVAIEMQPQPVEVQNTQMEKRFK